MGINETMRAYDSLVEYQLPIGGCLVNRITPAFDHPYLQKRREQELARIGELTEQIAGVNVGQLELADTEIVGLDALRHVGRLLYGEPVALPVTIGPHEIGEVLHHSVHRGMVGEIGTEHERIQLHFPGLERGDLSLRSEEGQLYVGVNGREQAIPTETHVKSSLVKASLEGDILTLLIPLGTSHG